jgi:hypothetical protein
MNPRRLLARITAIHLSIVSSLTRIDTRANQAIEDRRGCPTGNAS